MLVLPLVWSYSIPSQVAVTAPVGPTSCCYMELRVREVQNPQPQEPRIVRRRSEISRVQPVKRGALPIISLHSLRKWVMDCNRCFLSVKAQARLMKLRAWRSRADRR